MSFAEQHAAEVAALVRKTFLALLDRQEEPHRGPFWDSKFDLQTGKDFTDVLRGPETVYGWIQGRALEALCGQSLFCAQSDCFPPEERFRVPERARKVLLRMVEVLEDCRHRNGGRLFFMMRRDGSPLCFDGRQVQPLARIPEEPNFTDVFYAKGLCAAAHYLCEDALLKEALEYFDWCSEAVCRGAFRTDQQTFDEKNPVTYVPGKHPQGPRMILLLGLASAMELDADNPVWARRAMQCVERVMEGHVCREGRFHGLEEYDFVESLDDAGGPWPESDGAVVCDPGHALEFLGIAQKALRGLSRIPQYRKRAQQILQEFPSIYRQAFRHGFQPDPGGICKAYDLKKRQVRNSDMPWWNLPESMRAAAFLAASGLDAEEMDRCLELEWTAFRRFLNPDCADMAYQTRNAAGEVADVIPATPDADPGYHTNLSLIDCLKTWGGR